MESWLGIFFWFSRGDLDQYCLRAPNVCDIPGWWSGPSSAPSLDPRILTLVECAAISNVSIRISGLSGVTTLCPWARHINYCIVPVPPRKTRPDITGKLLTGMWRIESYKITRKDMTVNCHIKDPTSLKWLKLKLIWLHQQMFILVSI